MMDIQMAQSATAQNLHAINSTDRSSLNIFCVFRSVPLVLGFGRKRSSRRACLGKRPTALGRFCRWTTQIPRTGLNSWLWLGCHKGKHPRNPWKLLKEKDVVVTLSGSSSWNHVCLRSICFHPCSLLSPFKGFFLNKTSRFHASIHLEYMKTKRYEVSQPSKTQEKNTTALKDRTALPEDVLFRESRARNVCSDKSDSRRPSELRMTIEEAQWRAQSPLLAVDVFFVGWLVGSMLVVSLSISNISMNYRCYNNVWFVNKDPGEDSLVESWETRCTKDPRDFELGSFLSSATVGCFDFCRQWPWPNICGILCLVSECFGFGVDLTGDFQRPHSSQCIPPLETGLCGSFWWGLQSQLRESHVEC